MYLAHQMILLGSASPYTRPIYQLPLLLVLLLCGVAVGLFVITLRRGVKSHEGMHPPSRMALTMPHLQSKAGRIGKTLIVLVLGAVFGWSWRSYQYDRARIVYQREHDAWKQKDAQYDRDHAAFQEAVAKWKAKQKENR